jgi:serine phosphatase RsbU (regulator of sigma subunit)
MANFYEPATPSCHVTVIDDGSSIAREVIAQLYSAKHCDVATCSLAEFPNKPIRNNSIVCIVAAGDIGSDSLSRIREFIPSKTIKSIVITDNPILFERLGMLASDALLWPLASGLLQQRLLYLQQLQVAQDQIDGLRQSLAWHKARVDREHQLVEHIFQNALSRNYLEYAHVHTYLTPVSKFNGDLCLIAPGPLGNIYMLMADFTGHGLAPATGALPLSQAFFAMSDRGVSVAEMVTEFNYRMSRLLPDDMFCAAILLELSANGERVTYWNGGMPAALLFSEHGEILKRMSPAHMALGVVDDHEFDSRVATFRAPRGSSIALFTDGVTELLGHQHKFLGSEALEMLLSRYPRNEDFASLVDELERFRGETPLHDDLSLAILSCQPTGLGEVKPEPEQFGLPFIFESVLQPEHLMTIDPVAHILSALSQLPHLRRHRTTVYLFLAEAFNNALEHGLLELDSSMKQDPEGFAEYYRLRLERLHGLQQGEIRIRVHFEPSSKQLTVSVTDSGKGTADVAASAKYTEKSHGRGLELLRQMTTSLSWDAATRTVSFKYLL